ncbi:MAG: DUF29 domain-containing protein [Acidobacteriia bacterium]|nr:DUF29 domain-containing protein [Terriglobia bacterium]MBV8905597.1 DUF29 domain-containing protein [Terriglobia bacterium]
MSTATKTLYETDFVEWADRTAELLRERKFDEVDWEHLIEEVEGLAGSDRRAIRSQLLRLLMHLIKERIQPERAGTSWRTSIVNAQQEIGLILEDSPSLKRYLESALQKSYRTAVSDALRETQLTEKAEEFHLPHNCPFTVPQLLKDDPNTLRGMLK